MEETRTPDVATEQPGERGIVVDRVPVWRRVVKWAGIAVATLAVLAAAAVLGLNTAPGRAFVARQISNTTSDLSAVMSKLKLGSADKMKASMLVLAKM